MKAKIDVVQMNSTDSLKENLAYPTAKIHNAASEGVDLVTFPDTFFYIGQYHQQKHKVAQALDSEIVETFRDLTIRYDVSI